MVIVPRSSGGREGTPPYSRVVIFHPNINQSLVYIDFICIIKIKYDNWLSDKQVFLNKYS